MENHVEVEEIKSNKKIMNTVLDNFTKITKGQKHQRVRCGFALLKHLSENKNAENGKQELKYTLNRIIRGLGASTVNTRAGFFALLVGILSWNDEITVGEIFQCMQKELQTGKSNSKSENADIFTGQILVCGAIIHSKLFHKSTKDEQEKVLRQLLTAGKKRSYLSLASFSFIVDLFEEISKDTFEKLVLPILTPEIKKPWNEQTLDSIYIILRMQNKYPDVTKKFLKNAFNCQIMLCEENYQPINELLFGSSMTTTHPVYQLIAEEISKMDSYTTLIKSIDVSLAKPNRTRHIAVTNFLIKIIENLKQPNNLPEILQKYFIKHTITYLRNHRKNVKDELHDVLVKFFQVLLTTLKKEEKSHGKISLIKKLIFSSGVFNFEMFTKTKIIQQIISTLDDEGVKELNEIFKEVVLGELQKKDDNVGVWSNNDRLYAAQLSVKLIGHSAVQNEKNWKAEQLKFYADICLVKNENLRSKFGSELLASLKLTFFSALDQKYTKLEDLHNILIVIFNHIQQYDEENLLFNALKGSVSDVWQKTVIMVKKLESKLQDKSKKNDLNVVFHILFLHMGLQLFKDTKLATDSINELFSCYERTRQDKKRSLQSEISEEPLWIEVVTDLFLNLLSHSSHFLRNIIKCVFPYLCQHINATAIHQILMILDPKSEVNPLTDKGEVEDSESEEDFDANAVDDQEESNESSDEDDDYEMEDINTENETVNDQLRQAVRNALGTNGYQTDEESIDVDDISDTEAKNLNAALGEAFKKFKPNLGQRKGKKEKIADETLTHFRIRVLDLIEIYIDSNPPMILTLEIMLPLLQLLEFTVREKNQQPLQDRLRTCLRKLSNLKKFPSIENINEDIITELLRSILAKGTRNSLIVQDMDQSISECCVFIMRCSQFLNCSEQFKKKSKKKLTSNLIEILEESLDSFFRTKDSIIPFVLFKEILQLNWLGNISLARKISEICFDPTIKLFKQCQALNLLKNFYMNSRLLNFCRENQELLGELKNVEEFLYEKVSEFLENLNKENSEKKVNEKFISNVFLVLSVMRRARGKNYCDVNWTRISELIQSYKFKVKFSKDTANAYKTLCKSLRSSKDFQINGVKEDDTCSIDDIDSVVVTKRVKRNSLSEVLDEEEPICKKKMRKSVQ